MMNYETTFAMIKPGAIHRGLIGEIINRFERRGLNIVGMKLVEVSSEQAHSHYEEHKSKAFYPRLITYIMSGPVVILAIRGENATTLVRNMAGATNPEDALPGTIRGDFSADIENNIIHTSDSMQNAQKELEIYFRTSELIDYSRITNKWSFEVE